MQILECTAIPIIRFLWKTGLAYLCVFWFNRHQQSTIKLTSQRSSKDLLAFEFIKPNHFLLLCTGHSWKSYFHQKWQRFTLGTGRTLQTSTALHHEVPVSTFHHFLMCFSEESKLISTEKRSRSKGTERQTQSVMQLDLTPTNENGFRNCGWILVESQWKLGRWRS